MSRRNWIIAAVVAGVALGVLLIIPLFNHPRTISDQSLDAGFHPVWREFASGRISPGTDFDELVRLTQPTNVVRFGNHARLTYMKDWLPNRKFSGAFAGVTALVYEGKLASTYAFSCGGSRRFFNELTPEQEDEFWTAYSAHYQKMLAEMPDSEE